MSTPIVHWLYPINASSDYWLEDVDTGERTAVSPEELLTQVEKHPDRLDTWHMSTAFRLMQAGDAVWIYAGGRDQAICALGRAMQVYQDDGVGWQVLLRWNLAATRRLMAEPIPRSLFGQIPQSVRRADETTQRVLASWLSEHGAEITALDNPGDPASREDARDRVLAEIVRRRGQGAFRALLLKQYEGRCVVTGETAVDVLEAAHIDRYRGWHSHVPANGVLLRSDLHTLFDLHLIGVDARGDLVVSRRLDSTSHAKLRGTTLRLPTSPRARPSKARLAAHLADAKRMGTIP
jgi:hypothetical protein